MAEEIKVGEFSIGEALGIAVSKQITERVLMMTPVGNSTYMSGALKLALAYGVGKYAPPMGGIRNMVATGIAVDGAEDIAVNLVGMIAPMIGLGAAQSSADAQANNVFY